MMLDRHALRMIATTLTVEIKVLPPLLHNSESAAPSSRTQRQIRRLGNKAPLFIML